MSWAVRVADENGRLQVVDVVFGTKPVIEGAEVTRAEFLFRKPAGALFIKRALVAGLLDPNEPDQVAGAVRTMATVSGAKTKEQVKEFRALIFGIAKNVMAPINTQWSYGLGEYHHPLATRMMNYFKKVVADTNNPPIQ